MVTGIVVQVEINHAGIEVQPELEVRQIVQIGGGKGTPGAGVCKSKQGRPGAGADGLTTQQLWRQEDLRLQENTKDIPPGTENRRSALLERKAGLQSEGDDAVGQGEAEGNRQVFRRGPGTVVVREPPKVGRGQELEHRPVRKSSGQAAEEMGHGACRERRAADTRLPGQHPLGDLLRRAAAEQSSKRLEQQGQAVIGVERLRVVEDQGLEAPEIREAAGQQRGDLYLSGHEKESIREEGAPGGQVVWTENRLEALHVVPPEVGLGALGGQKALPRLGRERGKGCTEQELLGTGVTFVGTFEGLFQGAQGRLQGAAGIPGVLAEEEAEEAEKALLYQQEMGCLMDGIDVKLFRRCGTVHPHKVVVVIISSAHPSTSGWRSA